MGDRENKRIEIFDADGNFLKECTGLGYPYGLFITADQRIWMVDGGYDRILELDPGGKILGALGEPGHAPGQIAWGHCLAVGKDRKIYVAEVLNWRFQVFAPTTPSGKLQEDVLGSRGEFGMVLAHECAKELGNNCEAFLSRVRLHVRWFLRPAVVLAVRR